MSGAGVERVSRRAVGALVLLAVAVLLSMSVWFSASFVVPQLRERWTLTDGEASLLTIAVQIGFVVGALGLAASGLADAIPGRRLMFVGAVGAGITNALLLVAPGLTTAVVLRAATGALLAGVYPPAMKEVSTWFRRGRGTALAVMIAALTLGSAAPQLIKATGTVSWQLVIIVTSILTIAGGAVVLLIRGSGPFPFPETAFDLRGALRAARQRSAVLANVGYIGHMWELYAMWAWIGTYLAGLRSFADSADGAQHAALAAFGCIGIGAIGCVVGGLISDRIGRAQSALIALVGSGTAAIVLSFIRDAPLPVVLTVAAFWGFWVIADSAQFSAILTESVDPRYVGSSVSLQLGLGYITTAITIYLVPVLVDRLSWTAALLTLAVGPLVGAAAMLLHVRTVGAGRPVLSATASERPETPGPRVPQPRSTRVPLQSTSDIAAIGSATGRGRWGK